MAALETISRHRTHGGWTGYYSHASRETGTTMKVGVFEPPAAEKGKVPVLVYLAGLTCDETTFLIKADAQRLAAELGIMLIAPDTSPRGLDIPGIKESWDFGEAAGFYLNATNEPWAKNFRMDAYVTGELLEVVGASFPNADLSRLSIFGHSMGGHGALTLALKNPGKYRSVSAFAPIVAPTQVPWGHKALPRYLGEDKAAWANHDTVELLKAGHKFPGPVLVDQGLGDKFLAEQLRPELLEQAAKEAGADVTVRRHEGYDHGYFFIQTFMDDHLRHHAKYLT